MSDLRIVFVLSPYQNAFFFELADALIEALRTSGVDAIATTEAGAHHVGERDVFVLLPPHEYVALEGSSFVDDPVAAARTVGFTAEQPHQSFFERNASIGARLGGVLDFSPLAVAGYRRLGVEAEHLPFGYVPSWDARALHPRSKPPHRRSSTSATRCPAGSACWRPRPTRSRTTTPVC